MLLRCRMLVAVDSSVGIRMYVPSVEDALFGFYLSGWDLRHLHSDRFW